MSNTGENSFSKKESLLRKYSEEKLEQKRAKEEQWMHPKNSPKQRSHISATRQGSSET